MVDAVNHGPTNRRLNDPFWSFQPTRFIVESRGSKAENPLRKMARRGGPPVFMRVDPSRLPQATDTAEFVEERWIDSSGCLT